MNVAVLRISGPENALDQLIARFTLEPEVRWKKGDRTLHGVHSASGFNLPLADAATSAEMMNYVRRVFRQFQDQGIQFHKSELDAQLNIGLAVGDSTQFIAHVEISVDDAQRLSDLGITLKVTAYPVSDEVAPETGT